MGESTVQCNMPTESLPSKIKIPFDSLTLAHVTNELCQMLRGGQIQDIRQPEPTVVVLGIRSLGKNYNLLLTTDPQHARVHLTQTRPQNVPIPPSFCMALRKHCEGMILLDIRQIDFDRILEIEIGRKHSEGEDSAVRLVAELMGKHSNLVLVDAGNQVIDSIKRVSHRINRVRETLPGVVYQPPPQQSKLHPHQTNSLEWFAAQPTEALATLKNHLQESFVGISSLLAEEVVYRFQQSDEATPEARFESAWQTTLLAVQNGQASPTLHLIGDKILGAYPIPLLHLATEKQPVPVLNHALDTHFTAFLSRLSQTVLIRDLRGQMEADKKRVAKQHASITRTLEEGERAEQHKQAGELILSNLWQIPAEVEEVLVQDYFTPTLEDRRIVLDPNLTPQENADHYFSKYRKLREAAEAAHSRLGDIEATLKILEDALSRLAAWELEGNVSPKEIAALRSELQAKGLLQPLPGIKGEAKTNTPDFQGHKIRRYTSADGYEIYIGETATANDYLTTRLAASNDIWLHVRASAGSHVIIRTHGKPDMVPRSTLEQAALLCALHSSQKHATLVPVDYTLKKFVRKPRGSAAGSADYTNEITLDIYPEEAKAAKNL